ncbi:MAG: YraN family protein [Candidatus Omnitrophica bacterium]|nr:YraN family protein [Candidatus Omnitrophota bacterium]
MIPYKNSKVMGADGEGLAVEFLKRRGYRILERNFRTRLGEIDIIGEDQGVLCFIEVKTRNGTAYGRPVEAVSFFKQQKLSRMALIYLSRTQRMNQMCRFDIVGIDMKDSVSPAIELLQNAFDVIH